MAPRRAFGKERRVRELSRYRGDNQNRHKHWRLRFWAAIANWNKLYAAVTCYEGDIDTRVCVCHIGAGRGHRLVGEALDAERGSAVGLSMDGLKGDVPIGPKTEHHTEWLPKWGQTDKQEKRCHESPKRRHG